MTYKMFFLQSDSIFVIFIIDFCTIFFSDVRLKLEHEELFCFSRKKKVFPSDIISAVRYECYVLVQL